MNLNELPMALPKETWIDLTDELTLKVTVHPGLPWCGLIPICLLPMP